jgi:hypothetical protein
LAAPALSLIGGIALLLPFASEAIAVSRAAIAGGTLDWIRYQPPLDWFYAVLRDDASNKSLFRLFLALTAFGLWRHLNRAPLVPMFMASVGSGPFLAVAMLSLFGRPMMVDRYVLLALIAFLGLAAIGAAALKSTLGRVLILLLMVSLSARALRRSSFFWVDWKAAAALASAGAPANAPIEVVPAYAVNVTRYYLSPSRRSLATGVNFQCGSARILIISPANPVPAAYISELNGCYPRLLGRATRVEVRTR